MTSVRCIVKSREGLHARPAADLCKAAMGFKSAIALVKDGNSYEAKSILMVLCAGAVTGDEIEIRAEGVDEEKAAKALAQIIERGD